MRITGIQVTRTPEHDRGVNLAWTIAALCSDGRTRVQRQFMCIFKPGMGDAQESLDRWPSLWEVVHPDPTFAANLAKHDDSPQLAELRNLLKHGA